MDNREKILFITTLIKGVDHILDKVIAQCDSLKNLGYDVDLIFIGNNYKLYLNKNIVSDLNSKTGIQILFFNRVKSLIQLENYSFVYIRNPFVINQISYINFLKSAKKNNCQIVLEIPTFPYKLELNNFQSKIIYYSEKLFSGLLKKYITLILYSGDKFQSIYGINCKQLFNIGDLKSFPLSESIYNKTDLRLVGVSSCSIYHAYERIIEGLNLYYKNKRAIKVEFHIVGTGPYFDKYFNLVKKYSLESFVFFHGKLYGDSLDRLLNDMHVGISSLGMHRIGLTAGSPLKTSEYAARGLPFVLSYYDTVFSNKKFCFEAPGSEEAIDIEKLVNWYSSNKFKNKTIRDFTINNVSWEKQFENILMNVKQQS
jgi:hypothetical protein